MSRKEILIAVGVIGILMLGIGFIIGRERSKSKTVRVSPTPAKPFVPAPPRRQLPKVTTAPTTQQMETLGQRVAKGDEAAFAELEANALFLYHGVDLGKDRERAMTNLRLMKATYQILGESAAEGNATAMEMLKQSLRAKHLKSFAPDALGMAAARGNTEALEILLHPERSGMLPASAVFGLRAAAEANNEQAVDYLVAVIDDPKSRPLWHGASTGLIGAANKGNAKAQAAMQRYEEASRRRPTTGLSHRRPLFQ